MKRKRIMAGILGFSLVLAGCGINSAQTADYRNTNRAGDRDRDAGGAGGAEGDHHGGWGLYAGCNANTWVRGLFS